MVVTFAEVEGVVTVAEMPVGTVTGVTFAEVAVVTVAEMPVLNGVSCRTTVINHESRGRVGPSDLLRKRTEHRTCCKN